MYYKPGTRIKFNTPSLSERIAKTVAPYVLSILATIGFVELILRLNQQ